jgi:anaerobic dimethyl sulfoxide reductase subunit B (iron-sulfur subunit)
VEACPYNAPKMANNGKVNIIKCNLCLDRLNEGIAPACFVTCPTEALDYGPMDELIAKYGELRELAGFTAPNLVNPSIVFRAMAVER